jgi:1-acyl-sn-glycerol-3-phosphate acyltransferase
MSYKNGDPIIHNSRIFRAVSVVVFLFIGLLARIVTLLLYSTRYENTRLLRKWKGRAVLVANHTTFLDPIKFAWVALPKRIWQMMLEKSAEAPIVGDLTAMLGGVPIPAGRSGYERFMASVDLLFSRRQFIHFYAEGECYLYNQQIRPFKTGAFLLALKLGIPVIPIVNIFYEGRFKRGHPLSRPFPRERIVVLPPMCGPGQPAGQPNPQPSLGAAKRFAEAVHDAMQAEIDRRRAADPRAGTQAYYRGQMERIKGINT